MKNKKFALLALLVALVMVFTVVLAACQDHKCTSECPECGKCTNKDCKEEACKDKCEGHESVDPVYTGLFVYTRIVEGAPTTYNDLVLKEDGFFYLITFMQMKYVGKYEYNANKTSITFSDANDEHYNKTCNIEINEDGAVVIKDFTTWYYNVDDEWYSDDYVYNTVRDVPEEPQIILDEFGVEGDEDAKLVFYKNGTYELALSEPDLLSAGKYTSSKTGDTTTYSLTDEFNKNGSTYTFTVTDGYSNMVLKGTGLPAEGIVFTHAKELQTLYKGELAAAYLTAELEQYSDGSYSLTYAMYGAETTVSGSWTEVGNELTFNLPNSGEYKASVKSITVNADGSITIVLNLAIDLEGNTMDFTVTLIEYKKLASYEGELESASLTATLDIYSDNTYVFTYAMYGFPSTVEGTWSQNNGQITVNIPTDATDTIKSVTVDGDTITVVLSLAIDQQGTKMDFTVVLTDVSAEREPMMVYTGTAKSEAFGSEHDEVVTIKFYSETEVEIEFTIMGNENRVSGTAETAYPNINFTWDDENPSTVCIVSCVATIGADFSMTIEVTISTENIPGFRYTVTLTMVA